MILNGFKCVLSAGLAHNTSILGLFAVNALLTVLLESIIYVKSVL